MEPRKITIANSRDQKKNVIMSAATTLGELKQDLIENGIDYADMDFIEALTKTQLRGDDSVLPHDVPYNHTVTNELVFLLTVPNRKIKSGGRDEVYQKINGIRNSTALKDAIKEKFGRNYTMVSTSDLESFVEDWQYFHKDPTPFNPKDITPEARMEERFKSIEQKLSNLHEAMMEVIDVLKDDYITDGIYDALTGDVKKDRTVYSAGMSAEEIDDLVNQVD